MLCRKCHTLNEIGNRFCAGCGVDLAEQARQAKKIKKNRLGCLGCLGMAVVLAVALVVAVFFYLKTRDFIYRMPDGRWAITCVTAEDPVLYQSDSDKYDPKAVISPMTYRVDGPRIIFGSNTPRIRLVIQYLALHLNGDVPFEVRTYRVMPRAEGAAYVAPTEVARSLSKPNVQAGYRSAAFALFDPETEPESGEYLTRIFVKGRSLREATFFIDRTLSAPAAAPASH